jgi:hypothetical protein
MGLLPQHGRDRQQRGQRLDRRVGAVPGPYRDRLGGRRDASAAREQVQEAGQLPRRRLDELAPAVQQRGRVGGVVEHLGEHHVADRIGVQFQGGDDAEVAARAAQRPVQVRVVGGVRADDPSVGEHHLGGGDVIDGEAELAPRNPIPPAVARPPTPTSRKSPLLIASPCGTSALAT